MEGACVSDETGYTPGMRVASLVLTGLLGLIQPAQAEEAPCPYAINQAKGPREVTKGSAECRAMLAIQDDFLALRKAAGYTDAEVRLGDFIDRADFTDTVAEFDKERRAINFVAKALPVMGREQALRRMAIAHELGHAKQLHEGIHPPRAIPDPSEMRGEEAQADAFGLHLLIAAGFTSETAWDGMAAFYDFLGDAESQEDRNLHPSPGARFLNIHAFKQPGASVAPGSVKLADFNERGILRPELWVPQRLESARAPTRAASIADFSRLAIAAAAKLVSSPQTETTLLMMARTNRGTDLAQWVTLKSISAVP